MIRGYTFLPLSIVAESKLAVMVAVQPALLQKRVVKKYGDTQLEVDEFEETA